MRPSDEWSDLFWARTWLSGAHMMNSLGLTSYSMFAILIQVSCGSLFVLPFSQRRNVFIAIGILAVRLRLEEEGFQVKSMLDEWKVILLCVLWSSITIKQHVNEMQEFQSWMQKHFPLDFYLLITFFSLGKIHHLQSPEFVKLVIVFYLQMVQCLGGLKKKNKLVWALMLELGMPDSIEFWGKHSFKAPMGPSYWKP